MSSPVSYSREDLQRISDRKKRKLAIDDSDKLSEDRGVDSQIAVIDDSQSPLPGYRDLFGELIPTKPTSKPGTNDKPVKKKPTSRKKKLEESFKISPRKRPTSIFIPTPRIIKIMKEAQSELYSLMGLNKSSSDISNVSIDSLDVSGIQQLPSSPTRTPNAQKESRKNFANNEINEELPQVFKGIVAFVDYKVNNNHTDIGVTHRLHQLGAKVEKSFNLKVTHVVFRDGYRKTFDTAISRNIPLVSAKWVENCRLANKILDPIDYPPIDIEKYTKKRPINYNHAKYNSYKKFLRQSYFEHDKQLKLKCESFMKRIKQFSIEYPSKNQENCIASDVPKTIKNTVDPCNINYIIDALSDQLCKVLNAEDSSLPDEQIDELYIPMSIKTLRKYLTPKGIENKTPTELDSDLVKIEDRLNLNSQARQRLRKLLFPSDKELHNMSDISDFPSPSPQKIRISAPSRLTSKKKKKIVLDENDKEILPRNKNLINNENTPQKKTTDKNEVLKWRIPTVLRPKKMIKMNNQREKGLTHTQETIPNNILSRNSSKFFETPKNSLASPILSQTITCTGMTKREIDIIKVCIQNLGTFDYQSKVMPSTTYLITKSQPNRTLNMVFAMAYGCCIISDNWVHESHKIGRWLPHQHYLISDLSEPVKEFQTLRHTFGSSLTFHIFDDAGSIYISDTCQPPAKQLKQLVRVCGGQCTSIETMANVVVGYTLRMNNNISEKWILDCITQGSLQNKYQYMLTNNIINLN